MHPDLDTGAASTESQDPQLRRRLCELPDAEVPPYEFSEFSRRYSRRRLQQGQRPWRLMAAALAVLIGGWVLRHGLAPVMQEPRVMQASQAMQESQGMPGPQAMLESPAEPGSQSGDALEARIGMPKAGQRPVLLPTVNAQSWLDEHPRHAIIRVPTQMVVTELEDQIATLDDQLNAVRLSQPPARQLALLQRDRAQLVESLAQVRYAQNLMAGLQ